MKESSKPVLYLFIDEGGNLDFSPTGTRHYTMTSVALLRPFRFEAELSSLKLDWIERGIAFSGFHATNDREPNRAEVFKIIHGHLQSVLRLDRVLIRKSEMQPSMRSPERFYSETLGFLVHQTLLRVTTDDYSQIIVVTDNLPPGKKAGGIEKAIKHVLNTVLPQSIRYRVLHHPASEWHGLQVADYLNWAFFRRWERGDKTWDTRLPTGFAQYVIGTEKGELEDSAS